MGVAEVPDPVQGADRGNRGEHRELSVDRLAAGKPAHPALDGHRVERKRDVEHDVDAQRPRRDEAVEDRAAVVDPHEPVVLPEVVAEHAGQTGPDRQQGEADPVPGYEAQHPAPPERRRRLPRFSTRSGGDVRPVEQEPGQEEEQRQPDPEGEDQMHPSGVGAQGDPGDESVNGHDCKGGQAPNAVKAGEPRTPGRRLQAWPVRRALVHQRAGRARRPEASRKRLRTRTAVGALADS